MNYLKIYKQLINKAKDEILEGYTEKHHIIPRCIGGNNSKENLVKLTPKQHFLCHLLLVEIYPDEPKLKQALWLMASTSKYISSGRLYERLKNEFIEIQKGKIHKKSTIIKMKKWWSLNKKTRPQEVKDKISETKRMNPSLMDEKRKQKHRDNSSTKKPITQFTLEGAKVKDYISINEASRQTGIRNDCLSACVRGIQNTSGGYIWKYKK